MGRFKDGAEQFRRDVAVNPSDTEEALWAFLCEAQISGIGFEKARVQMLVVGRDPRPYCQKAYDLFKGTATEEDLAHEATPSTPAEFYANMYLGLFAEARGEADKARACTSCRPWWCLRARRPSAPAGSHNQPHNTHTHTFADMTAACKTKYAQLGRDYMVSLAKVHLKLRGWA